MSALAACSLLSPPIREEQAPAAAPVPVEPPKPQYAPPIGTHRFEIDAAHDDVVGQVQVTISSKEDTLPDIARRFNLGYEEIVRANPGVDPWLPGAGKEIVLPTQFVLPNSVRQGIVINIAAMRLFYFPPTKPGEKQVVYTHPIGIGRVGWQTPEGATKVVSKQKDPVWIPPASVRKEHKENGEILPARVPAGPDNPLGKYKFTLGWPSYLIHGTNKPYGVGLRSSHGCIRLYPEDVEKIFAMVNPGTGVTVVNQPFVFGWHDGELYLQGFDVLEDDKRDWSKSQPKLLSKTLSKRIQTELANRKATVDWQRVAQITKDPRGLVLSVSTPERSEDVVIAAAPRVENRIPQGANWDGADDPALQAQSDVKVMVQEQQQAPRS
ncbi:MAG: L,D-transpeptidase family protein [Proteobacteria bacterium]|nr:L,D-transpeptidase family protein [Pseudomonadota bacterium]MBK9250748.1 L,D-transpeptidase family protein [Pseudomonadota bacterium]MCC6632805.1 L,D-transpeptidase family protein [Gammaproteobacteria bacterium]